MAFPVIQGTPVVSNTLTTGTSHTVNLPTGITSGERLYYVFAVEGTTAAPTITGWTVTQVDLGASGGKLYHAYKQATGSEGSTATMTTDASTEMSGRCYRISGHDSAVAPEGTGNSGANSTTYDCPAHTASWGADDNLWFAILMVTNGGRTISTYPSGSYINTGSTNSGGADGFLLGWAQKDSAVATEDPGPFTVSAGAAGSFASTIVMKPAGGASPVSTNVAAATITAGAQAATPTMGAVTTTATTAPAIALAAQPATVTNVPPTVTVNAAAASLTMTAETATVTGGPASTSLATADLTMAAQAVSVDAGAGITTTPLATATITAAAQAATVVPGEVSTPLATATIVSSASAVTLDTPRTISLATASLTGAGQAATVSNPPPPTAVLTFAMSGGLTDTSFKARAKVTTGASGGIKLAAYSNSGRTTKVAESGTLTPNASNYVIGEVTGLSADTNYWYGWLDGGSLRSTAQGEARTFPTASAASSFTFWAASCSSTNNPATFATINGNNPDFGIHLGDFDYENINTTVVADHVSAREIRLGDSGQSGLYRDHPLVRTWSDHDYCGNGSDSTATGKAAAQEAWRRMEPDYTLPATSGNVGAVYKSFQVGRFHFFMMDTRSEADVIAANPTSTTRRRISATQETALLDWFDAHPSDPKIVISAEPWHSPQSNTEDDWGNFVGQRNRISSHITTNGISNIAFLSGDMHACAWQDSGLPGSPNVLAAMQSAPLARPGASHKGGPWDLAEPPDSASDPRCYGFFTVTDTGGSTATLRFSARDGTTDAELWDSDLSVVTFSDIGAAGPITVDAQPATITTTANAATQVSGAASVSAGTANLAMAAQAVTLDTPLTISTAPASLTLAAQVIAAGGVTNVPLATASLTMTADAATFVPGAATTALAPASLTLLAQTVGVGGVTVVPLATATLTGAAQAATPVGGSLSIPVAPATVVSAAQAAQLVPGATSIALTTGSLALAAQNTGVLTGVIVFAAPATIPLSAQAAQVVPGASSISLAAASVATLGQAASLALTTTVPLALASLTVAAQNVTEVPGTLTITAASATVQAAAQAVSMAHTSTIVLDPATLTMAAQTTQLIRGPTSIALQPAALSLLPLDFFMEVVPPPPERIGRVSADGRVVIVTPDSRRVIV
jgi:hypothetical protein